MKDAFGKKLQLDDKVIYSTKGGGGTEYIVGKIVRLLPYKKSNAPQYKVDKVEIEVAQTNRRASSDSKTIIYSSNVVLIKDL